jgi:hypothetical protein
VTAQEGDPRSCACVARRCSQLGRQAFTRFLGTAVVAAASACCGGAAIGRLFGGGATTAIFGAIAAVVGRDVATAAASTIAGAVRHRMFWRQRRPARCGGALLATTFAPAPAPVAPDPAARRRDADPQCDRGDRRHPARQPRFARHAAAARDGCDWTSRRQHRDHGAGDLPFAW